MALKLPVVREPAVQQALNRVAQQFPLKTQHFAEEVITVDKIVEGTITGDRIEGGTITGDLVAAGTLEGGHLKAGSVDATRLDVDELSAITADLGTVTAGTVKGVTFEGNTFTGETFEGVTIKGTTVEGGTIVGPTLKTAASGARVEIDSSGIRGINAEAKEKFEFDAATGILTATAVISSESGSVIDTEHLAGQITETQIEDDAISTPKLQANSVTAAEMSVSKLSAITADLGSITTGTITGATFRTSASNPKVQMDSEGLKSYDSEGNVLVEISGATSAIKSATIESASIKLPESASVEAPGDTSAVNWTDSEGKKLSRIAGVGESTFAGIYIAGNPTGGRKQGIVQIAAYNEGGIKSGSSAAINVQSKEGVQTVSAQTLVLAEGSGKSDFLQLPETAKVKTLWGVVNSGGSKGRGSAGWTCEKVATGRYKINISPELSTTATTMVTPDGEAGQNYVRIQTQSKTAVEVRLFNASFTLEDRQFNFHIFG